MSNQTLQEEIAIALFKNGSESWKKKTSEETKAYYRELADIALIIVNSSQDAVFMTAQDFDAAKALLAQKIELVNVQANKIAELESQAKDLAQQIQKLENELKQIDILKTELEKTKIKNETPKK